ncbi:MAG: hypothetical protein R3E12_17005 [Candidatus Eisenbacteria bacterium]
MERSPAAGGRRRGHDQEAGGNVAVGRGNELLRHCMEIRGIGIIDVQSIFGIRAIRAQKRVEVEINLQEWDQEPGLRAPRFGRAEDGDPRSGHQQSRGADLSGKNIGDPETIALNYLVRPTGTIRRSTSTKTCSSSCGARRTSRSSPATISSEGRKPQMVTAILVTHGLLGGELIRAAETILGKQDGLAALQS